MAYTQEQADNLRNAIAEGVTEVEFNGRRTRFRSLKEMRSILAEIESSVDSRSRGPGRNRVLMTFRRD